MSMYLTSQPTGERWFCLTEVMWFSRCVVRHHWDSCRGIKLPDTREDERGFQRGRWQWWRWRRFIRGGLPEFNFSRGSDDYTADIKSPDGKLTALVFPYQFTACWCAGPFFTNRDGTLLSFDRIVVWPAAINRHVMHIKPLSMLLWPPQPYISKCYTFAVISSFGVNSVW